MIGQLTPILSSDWSADPILSSDWSGEEPALAEVSGLGRGGGRGTAASPGAGPAASWRRRPGELGSRTLDTDTDF